MNPISADRLFEARKADGLTQDAVAVTLGMSRRNYQRLEKDEISTLSHDVVRGLMDLFGRRVLKDPPGITDDGDDDEVFDPIQDLAGRLSRIEAQQRRSRRLSWGRRR